MLPFKNIAIKISNEKITSNIALTICFELGKVEAQMFYTKAIRKVRRSNKGGLVCQKRHLTRLTGWQ
jgi:hypothetical protein